MDDAVRVHDPLRFWQQRHEVLFDLDRVCLRGQAESGAEATDVGVDDDAGRESKRSAQNDVCGLSANARKFDERVEFGRHFPVVMLYESRGHAAQVLGFLAKEAGRLDDLLDVLLL